MTISCSDKLSNAMAEEIMEGCLEIVPKIGQTYFYTGERNFYIKKEDDMEKLRGYNELS